MKFVYTAPGTGQRPDSKPTDLASRVFKGPNFAFAWVLFLFLVLIFVSFPIQKVLLVLWVYGREGYFHQGIRVLPRKPLRFSDGVLVPQELDMLTGAGMFVVTTFGLSLALFFALRLYERFTGKPQPSARP